MGVGQSGRGRRRRSSSHVRRRPKKARKTRPKEAQHPKHTHEKIHEERVRERREIAESLQNINIIFDI